MILPICVFTIPLFNLIINMKIFLINKVSKSLQSMAELDEISRMQEKDLGGMLVFLSILVPFLGCTLSSCNLPCV